MKMPAFFLLSFCLSACGSGQGPGDAGMDDDQPIPAEVRYLDADLSVLSTEAVVNITYD